MTRTIHAATPSRVAALLVAASFAATGACVLAAGSAAATPGDPHKVWVCKYVHQPGEDEVLKGGKNPIHVDEAALTNDRGVEPQLGDSFSDGQFRSVVVSLDDEAPTTACPAEAGATSGRAAAGQPAGSAATATATPSAPATSAAPATPTPTVDAAGTVAGSPEAPVALDGAAVADPQATVALEAVPALGDAAPHTGGMGEVTEESRTADVLVGVGLIAAAGALAGAEVARRRRRRTAEVD
ncbi:hypothetical protein [Intrasporangium sp. YIM S08009]|uniref:hypothetical protein n=1 Tax=Intrasporangium zincisolvens TaxID=3080018 RepID=UPI002B05AE7C|nr:hypothetical protein [Intrasporangium sp. YIM S08009]